MAIEWAAAALKALDLKAKYFFVAGIFSFAILYLPEQPAATFGLTSFRDQYRLVLGLVCLGSLSIWLAKVIPWSRFAERRERARTKKELELELDSLSEAEAFLLTYCVFKNRTTVTLPIEDPVARGLMSRGLLLGPSGILDPRASPYRINPLLWPGLLQRADLMPDDTKAFEEQCQDFEGSHPVWQTWFEKLGLAP